MRSNRAIDEVIMIVPTNDIKLRHLTGSIEDIEEYLIRRRIKHTIIWGRDIKRLELERLLGKIGSKKTLIAFYGHGCCCGNSLYGDYEEPLFDMDNIHLFNRRIVYTAACHSSRNLGRRAIAQGCESYLGYEDVLFIPDPNLPDYGVINCINDGLRMLVQGHSAQEVRDHIYLRYQEIMHDLVSRSNLTIPIFIQLNMDNLSLQPGARRMGPTRT